MSLNTEANAAETASKRADRREGSGGVRGRNGLSQNRFASFSG